MKQHYRGYELNVYRDKSIMGDEWVYLAIVREKDRLVVCEDILPSENNIREVMKGCKIRVDNEISELEKKTCKT